MKNHWLKKKDNITVEDIHLARELEVGDVESVCEYKELADDTLAPFDYGEVTIGVGAMPIKTEDITWNPPSNACISDTPCLLMTSISSISSITIGCDSASFEPGQTALAELDMEIGEGSIKYTREINIGAFTFKDAGALGVDIFFGANKVWLNSKGEEELRQWLGEKSVAASNVSVLDKTYTIGADPVFGRAAHKKVLDSIRNIPYKIQIVSNEVPDNLYGGTHKHNTYQLKNGDIIPGSVILTAYVNGVAVQSDNLYVDGSFGTYDCERPAISKVKLDYKTGVITVSWINSNADDVRSLSFCYEYRN